jgi:hypothetical protein
MSLVLLLFICLKFILIDTRLVVVEPTNLNEIYLYCTQYKFFGKEFEFAIKGNVIFSSPFDACSGLTNTNIDENSIVFVYAANCIPEIKALNVQSSGALAMVTVDEYSADIGNLWDMNFNIYTIALNNKLQYIQPISNFISENPGVNVTVVLYPDDDLYAVQSVWIPYIIIMESVILFSIGLGVYKLAMFIRVFGPEISLAQVCLGLECLCNIERFFYGIDPVGWGIKYHTFFSFQFMYTLSFPWSLGVTLLISLYWSQIISDQKRKKFRGEEDRNNFFFGLHKMKIPFVVFAILLELFDISSSVLRGERIQLELFRTIGLIVYIVLTFLVAIFYIINATKLIILVHIGTSSNHIYSKKHITSIKRLAFFMVTCIFGMLIHITGLVIQLSEPTDIIETEGAGYGPLRIFLIWIGLEITSLSQICTFVSPQKKKEDKKTGSIHDVENHPKSQSKYKHEPELLDIQDINDPRKRVGDLFTDVLADSTPMSEINDE